MCPRSHWRRCPSRLVWRSPIVRGRWSSWRSSGQQPCHPHSRLLCPVGGAGLPGRCHGHRTHHCQRTGLTAPSSPSLDRPRRRWEREDSGRCRRCLWCRCLKSRRRHRHCPSCDCHCGVLSALLTAPPAPACPWRHRLLPCFQGRHEATHGQGRRLVGLTTWRCSS